MSLPLDRLAALCPVNWRDDLSLLSDQQMGNLRLHIRRSIYSARRMRRDGRKKGSGRPPCSTHPRAAQFRAAAKRKYRRSRGENVPLMRPGPKPRSTNPRAVYQREWARRRYHAAKATTKATP